MRFVSPRLKPASLNALYSEPRYFKSDNSTRHGYVDYFSDRPNITATFERRFFWMERWAASGARRKLLDIGCAAGFAVEHALKQGWDAYGLEPSRYAAEVARQSLGDRVRCGTIDDGLFPDGSFQTVLLWDVIEHLPHPRKALEQIHALLEPEGLLSVITPDFRSPLARVMGRFWMEYAKPAEHIYFYSLKVLEAALRECGFDVVAASTAGKYVGLDFLLERLSAVLPPARRLRQTVAQNRLSKLRVYIDPGDKVFLLARKRPTP